jgi:23S rRNA pseudouridine2605 synthase/16S rRNA pseudouridine516 synthase
MARAGIMPLDEAERAIRERRVQLDSRVAVEALTPVHPTSRVTVDGHPVSLSWQTRVLMLNKPPGVISHGRDPEGGGTVFDVLRALISPELQRTGWHAVGRLDRDTTGLLLFTNDEQFVAHATAPETHLPKRYVARVGVKVDDAKLAPLRNGVRIDDGELTRPAKAMPRGDDSVELTLTEGRFHQVKRMLNAAGLPTLALHREAVGELMVDVEVGSFRVLTDAEVKDLLGFTPRRYEQK